ncbi:MAG: DUF1570 domain-containing protein [Phycisphaerales bacterium]|nr:DUF1570 domain-containing protein [Phycisphaerales bacterium]
MQRWRVPIAAMVLAVTTTAVAQEARDAGTPPPIAEDPRPEFAERLTTLDLDDPRGVLRLAQWAYGRGLLDEADALYRRVLQLRPGDEAAYHDLWHLSRGRELPRESESLEKARTRVPDTFRELETRRYVILSDADPGWLTDQGQRLERSYEQFVRFVNRSGVRAVPPRHKLVAVVFNQRSDFQAFAKRDGTGGRIAGYYRQPEDRLVFYHVESNENVAAARAELDRSLSEIDDLYKASRRAGSVGQRADAAAMRAEMTRRMDRWHQRAGAVDEFARQQSISVTVHEAIHQLMFHTGVQSARVQHPLWLSEGLATMFETDEPHLPFGPRHDYAPRRIGFYAIADRDLIVPLRSFIGATPQQLTGTPAATVVLYHQAYALVSWLAVHEKRGFAEYLRRLNDLPAGVPSASTQLATFEAAFGDIERLERRWLRHELGD